MMTLNNAGTARITAMMKSPGTSAAYTAGANGTSETSTRSGKGLTCAPIIEKMKISATVIAGSQFHVRKYENRHTKAK